MDASSSVWCFLLLSSYCWTGGHALFSGGDYRYLLLQTSLKRKHWDGGANARHSALFQQQMRLAAAQQQPDDAMRDQVRTSMFPCSISASVEAMACR